MKFFLTLLNNIKYVVLIGCICVLLFLFSMKIIEKYGDTLLTLTRSEKVASHLFPVQSIDTMKQSRDMARQILEKPFEFRDMIDTEMEYIREAGATHVAIDTPYDVEFLPVLEMWVAGARKHNLSVWFRGNFSGWEGWFNYPKISREEHKKLLNTFLKNNTDLFKNGDIFTPCPECENGGPGDPRMRGDHEGFRNFLIDEYTLSTNMFKKSKKSVPVYNSVNADIARYIMTPQSIHELGGTLLIDHYSSTVSGFIHGIQSAEKSTRGNIGIGELGAPIPDLNGNMTETEQAEFINSLFLSLYEHEGPTPVVNYWVLDGGSTALVQNGIPKKAYAVIKNYFTASSVYGNVTNSIGQPIHDADIQVVGSTHQVSSDAHGFYQVFLPKPWRTITVSKAGYATTTIQFSENLPSFTERTIVLEPLIVTPEYKIKRIIYNIKYGKSK